MNSSPRLTDDWTACPEGELQRLVRAQQSRERLRHLSRTAATAAAVLVCLVGYLALAAPSLLRPSATLGCQECQELFAPYHAQTLAAPLAAQIRTHLDRCQKCLDAYHSQFPIPTVSVSEDNRAGQRFVLAHADG